ncbi:hypothetical protein BKH43_01965 [Helicobacter sp. 13S00401-1]|uniref:CoA-binding protein n=1 Tax=Helicobacter sp. 13S00401-1 TaxID=1905758 RepID=UPI000BC9DC40|nr:CoA-binding protein [Helicobacter sp. 13S00401-1]PAF51429.1 hypothetical protein BKH43_01965 [Helicobacter sp. 13S00401-1]
MNIKDIVSDVKSIAIVGLSPDASKDSNMVGCFLQDRGFTIIPIYPKKQEILGKMSYPSLSEAVNAGETFQIVVVFRKSEAVLEIAREVLSFQDKVKIKCFWMQLDIRNEDAKMLLEKEGIVVVEDKCIKLEMEAFGL